LSRAYSVPVTVTDAREPGAPGPSAAGERELWRVAEEALSNALRHAEPSEIRVTVEGNGHTVLSVVDDGVGFDPGARSIAARRLGLVSMRERIEAVGGAFEIVSAPAKGTTVRASVP
jgi:signal transduction histidine kinase